MAGRCSSLFLHPCRGSSSVSQLAGLMGRDGVSDCTSCKVIGAGGCFAGALYALHERSKVPITNKNRRWLTVIGIGKHSACTTGHWVDMLLNLRTYLKHMQQSN